MELEQAGKVRELKDQAKKDAEAHALAQVEQFQVRHIALSSHILCHELTIHYHRVQSPPLSPSFYVFTISSIRRERQTMTTSLSVVSSCLVTCKRRSKQPTF